MIIDGSFSPTPCFPPTHVYGGGEYPSTLVSGLPTTAPPFASPPSLSHPTVPHSSGYIIYTDDISNSSKQ